MTREQIRKKNYEAAKSAVEETIAKAINRNFNYNHSDNRVNAKVTVDLEEETAILYINVKTDTKIIEAHFLRQEGEYTMERLIIENPDAHSMQTAHAMTNVLRDSIKTAISLYVDIKRLYVA